jgi:hypothetical protein
MLGKLNVTDAILDAITSKLRRLTSDEWKLIHITEWYLLKQYYFGFFGPGTGEVQPGWCGAPIVHEKTSDEESDGIVIDFVSPVSGTNIIVCALDDSIAEGWRLEV